jgi:hypothetical protein
MSEKRPEAMQTAVEGSRTGRIRLAAGNPVVTGGTTCVPWAGQFLCLRGRDFVYV